MPPLKREVFRCLNIDKIRFGNKCEQVSFSSLKNQGCKNIRHNIRFMSFAITRWISPPLISMVILNFNVLRLRCFYWMCLMKIAIALKKRSQITLLYIEKQIFPEKLTIKENRIVSLKTIWAAERFRDDVYTDN